jgi:Domain of unknown function (DUF4340)
VAPPVSAKRPFLTTYVALAVAAGLGAYIYFVESKKEPGSDKKKEKVFTLDKAQIASLSLQPREGEAVKLVKDQAKGWRMTAPLEVGADATEADAIVSSLESLEVEDVVSEDASKLAEFGLDKPRLTVEAVPQQGAALTLLLGDKAPAGSGLYAKLPSKPRVFTVPAYVESTFLKKPFDLRDRDVLHVKRDDVRGLEVSGPEGDYSLARDAVGEWAFKKPIATQAGRWAVDGFLGSVEGLKMESVVAEDPKDLKAFGLAPPKRSVTVQLATGVRRTLEIGGSPSEKKYHARDAAGGPVVVIASGLVDDLAKGMGNLRAKRLAEVAAYDVDGFDAELDGTKRAYAKSTGKDGKDGVETAHWKRTAPDAKDLESEKVQDVLFKLGGVEAQSFVDAPGPDAAYGLEKPILKLAVRKPTAKEPLVIVLGQKDGVSYARRSGDAAILKLDSVKVDELVKAVKEL